MPTRKTGVNFKINNRQLKHEYFAKNIYSTTKEKDLQIIFTMHSCLKLLPAPAALLAPAIIASSKANPGN